MSKHNVWVCIGCGTTLGNLIGKELVIDSSAEVKTQGANLVITCPKCNRKKVWYPSDPVLRAINQLIDALSSAMSSAAVRGVSTEIRAEIARLRQEEEATIGDIENE